MFSSNESQDVMPSEFCRNNRKLARNELCKPELLDDLTSSPMITSTRILSRMRQRQSENSDWEENDENRSLLRDKSFPNYANTDKKISTGCYVEYDVLNGKSTINKQREKDKLGSEKESNSISMSLMYGMINTAIILPVIMSFGSIIYEDPFFRPYIPILIKLTVISGVVHQIVFSTFSSLPFAVGQVQDAGLIFLSQISTNIVKYCIQNGYDAETTISTVTVGLSLCTFLLGIALIIIGRLQLVSIVQKLPMSVVGGYLAFIGFFCGQAGLCLMSGDHVKQFWQWYKFFEHDSLIKILPGLFGGILIYCAVRNIKHVAVLPTCIVSTVLLFYYVLYITNTTLEEARNSGWINQGESPPAWYHSWDFIRLDQVVWSALPQQTFTLISMIGVVALSSSLDVAAIELDLGSPLNYDSEIRTVGLSNLISGLTGGYTGSYIFSQTIFSMRSGVKSRLCGYILAIMEFISVMLPFSVLSYLPNFFFGSLLIMISIDLMWEWLFEVKQKVTKAEYIVVWSSFIFIQMLGVEYGIAAGIVLYLLGNKLGFQMKLKSDNSNTNTNNNNKYFEDTDSSSMDLGSINTSHSTQKLNTGNKNVVGIDEHLMV